MSRSWNHSVRDLFRLAAFPPSYAFEVPPCLLGARELFLFIPGNAHCLGGPPSIGHWQDTLGFQVGAVTSRAITCAFLLTNVRSSFGSRPRSVITGSRGERVFSSVRSHQTVSRSGCAVMRSHHSERGSHGSTSRRHSVASVFTLWPFWEGCRGLPAVSDVFI